MDNAKQEALERHIGYCVILCQQIEHLLAILLRGRDGLDHLHIGEFMNELTKTHTAPLERIRSKIEKQDALSYLLSDLDMVIEKRNKIVHRAVISKEFIHYVETGFYDFDSDILLFGNFRKRLELELDNIGITWQEEESVLGGLIMDALDLSIRLKEQEKRTRRAT
jgi:hypothetical protein